MRRKAGFVGVERFELSTSRTRTVRSTGLSHTPIKNSGIQKRANYTISICFCDKLWIQQYFLAVHVEQSVDTVIILVNGQACQRGLRHLVGNCCFKQLRIDLLDSKNAQAHGFAIWPHQLKDDWLKIERPN